jgi:lipoyl(octanoyl) transferase
MCYQSSLHSLTCFSFNKSATLYDLYNQQVPYEQAWAWQKQLVKDICASAADSTPSSSPAGAAILLQHDPVYTLGAGATEEHLGFNPETPPYPLFRTERGGEVTYHGPGQLVMYPILNLKLFQPDLHWYLRSLEEVIIKALEEVSGLHGERLDGLTGVWVNGKKVAAIGVRATRWVSYHGLALNITADLRPFQDIVPCGISTREVTSVVELLVDQGLEEDPYATRQDLLELHSGKEFQSQLMEEYRYGLLSASEEVFGLEWKPVLKGREAFENLISKGKKINEFE